MGVGDRPTADLVIIWLSGIVGIALLIAETAVFAIAINRPEVDIASIAGAVSDTTNVIIGAIVGYLAGKRIHPGDTDALDK